MAQLARRRTDDAGGRRLKPAPLDSLFPAATRQRLLVRGIVQGVGFRPFVARLGAELGLSGTVRNTGTGVEIELFGGTIAAFRRRLIEDAPPLARIDSVENLAPGAAVAPDRFSIIPSDEDGIAGAEIPADIAPCDACLVEMRDPANRRFGHAFISCTDCGPRYTIAEALPFDRARTAMHAFPMCEACAAEYADPASRRFHSQTNCCAACGPRLSHSVAEIAAVIRSGGIAALKGVGGYHLACDARNESAVLALRQRKRREAKPFAVMVGSVETARRLTELNEAEAAALADPSRPVVILKAVAVPVLSRAAVDLDAKRPEGATRFEPQAVSDGCAGTSAAARERTSLESLPQAVSGGLATLGLMLPSSPLQALLIDALGPDAALVMTSANLSGEPVITDDDEARASLMAIADIIVTHDRSIEARADDSVARVILGAPRIVRRGRGSAPAVIALQDDGPDVLALGGQLKSAACLLTGKRAFLSPHIGDLDSPAAVAALKDATERLIHFSGAKPVAIAHDAHPDFASTRLAELLGIRAIAVQHHHAHALAAAAECGWSAPFIAITLDGFGLGLRGADGRAEAWGGEILDVRGAEFTRLAHLSPIVEPGGDAAAREPWRVAAGLLHALGRNDTIAARFRDEPRAAALAAFLRNGPAPAMTTSAGRWFDAAAALLGVSAHNRFEGEAAMRLEALAANPNPLVNGWRRSGLSIDISTLAVALTEETDAARGSDLFHGTLIEALAETAIAEARRLRRGAVALGGGCFLNRVLTEGIARHVAAAGLTLLLPSRAPVNDGGLAFGQAVAARLILANEQGRRTDVPRHSR